MAPLCLGSGLGQEAEARLMDAQQQHSFVGRRKIEVPTARKHYLLPVIHMYTTMLLIFLEEEHSMLCEF